MPKKEFVKEETILTGFASYYFTLIFSYSLITFVINIVSEKEKNLKELMRIMGMNKIAFWYVIEIIKIKVNTCAIITKFKAFTVQDLS